MSGVCVRVFAWLSLSYAYSRVGASEGAFKSVCMRASLSAHDK